MSRDLWGVTALKQIQRFFIGLPTPFIPFFLTFTLHIDGFQQLSFSLESCIAQITSYVNPKIKSIKKCSYNLILSWVINLYERMHMWGFRQCYQWAVKRMCSREPIANIQAFQNSGTRL